MKRPLIAALAICLLAGLVAGRAAADRPLWIDVRSEQEFDADHLAGALLIPHRDIARRVVELGLEKDRPIYLYCRSGNRAGIAQAALESLGFTDVTNVGSLADAREMVSAND